MIHRNLASERLVNKRRCDEIAIVKEFSPLLENAAKFLGSVRQLKVRRFLFRITKLINREVLVCLEHKIRTSQPHLKNNSSILRNCNFHLHQTVLFEQERQDVYA